VAKSAVHALGIWVEYGDHLKDVGDVVLQSLWYGHVRFNKCRLRWQAQANSDVASGLREVEEYLNNAMMASASPFASFVPGG
jgi:hypothetical protein